MKVEAIRVSYADYRSLWKQAQGLSAALQNDCLQAALHIRAALYDHPESENLKNALIALDFPHFIPIENTREALEQELERLDDEWWEHLKDNYVDIESELAASMMISMRVNDVYEALNKWGYES